MPRHFAPVDPSRTFDGYSADAPEAGFYRFRLRSGGAMVGVRIWHGAPLDPLTGEKLDRSPRWQAEVNGHYEELERVWPMCARSPISEAEYRNLSNMQSWAKQNAPDSALANPQRRADPLSTPMLF